MATSKLDYLKKYMAAPGDGAPAAVAAKGKKDKPKKPKKGVQSMQDIRIRDMSEALPEAREERKEVKKKTVIAQGRRLCVDEDTVFVDKDVVDEAERRDDIEKSGVAWRIQQHKRPSGTRQAAKQEAKQEPKREVKAEVKQEEGDDGSDVSVPRGRAPTRAPGAARRVKAEGSGSDLSPPRKGSAPPAAPAAPAAGDDADLSPPQKTAAKSAAAPPKRQRHDSDSDMFPPRKAPASAGAAASKPRVDAADADLSPPRRPAPKVEAQRQRHDSDSDMSPQRKAAPSAPAAGADSDISPPRKAATAAPAARKRHDSDSDLSPPRKSEGAASASAAAGGRKRHDSDSDLSPPRKSGGAAASAPAGDGDDSSDLSPPRKEGENEKMSSGLKVGLVTGDDLKAQAAKVRADRKAALEAAPDEDTGRGATTVYRNKDGRRIDREEWVENQAKPRKKRKSEYPEQELEWGGGLKQRVSQEEQDAEVQRIAAQPFARYEPDEKHMQELRAKSDWNDPMREFEEDEEAAAGPAAGPTAAAKPKPKPKCPHQPWPNRFNILPGYRWDGKVRGNDFEKRWLQGRNSRELKKKEAYKWEQEMDQNS